MSSLRQGRTVRVFICLLVEMIDLKYVPISGPLLHHRQYNIKVKTTSEANAARPHSEHWSGRILGFIHRDTSWVHSASIDDISYMPEDTVSVSVLCMHGVHLIAFKHTCVLRDSLIVKQLLVCVCVVAIRVHLLITPSH